MSQSFVRGQFQTFRATTKIHLGKYATDIFQDAEFGFDGQVVRYGGSEFDVPQLRGLCGNWFVPVADTRTQYRSRPAGVQVHAATPDGGKQTEAFTMGQAEEDNAVVGTMDEATAIRKASNADPRQLAALREQQRYLAAQRQRAGLAESNPEAPPPVNAADVDPEMEAALMEDVEQRYVQARPVHSEGVGSATATEREMQAVATANRLNQERIAKATMELERRDPRKTREEMGGVRHDAPETGGGRKVGGGKYALIRDEQDDGVPVGNYKFSDGATVGHQDDARNSARPIDVTRVASQQPVQVGQAVAAPVINREAGAVILPDPMTTHAPQAARARNTTQIRRDAGNVGIDEIGPGCGTGDVDVAVASDDLADLVPSAMVAGQVRRTPGSRLPAPPPRLSESDEISEIVAGWSTKRHWMKRVEEAVDFYGEWPEALEAIFTIESPAVVKQIQNQIAAKIAEG